MSRSIRSKQDSETVDNKYHSSSPKEGQSTARDKLLKYLGVNSGKCVQQKTSLGHSYSRQDSVIESIRIHKRSFTTPSKEPPAITALICYPCGLQRFRTEEYDVSDSAPLAFLLKLSEP